MESIYSALQPVKSSMFSRAGYDEATWQLLFEFKTTQEIRSYSNVIPETAYECLTAESLGKWFNANIRGNRSWEYEVLGSDPATMLPPAPKRAEVECGLTEEELDFIAPGIPAEVMGLQSTTYPSYGGIQRGAIEFQPLDPGPPAREGFDAEFTSEISIEDAKRLYPDTALTAQPVGEVLAPWQPPQTAVEAIKLLDERADEIDSIIRQNVQTGADALTVRVTTPEGRVSASETLNRLVSTNDTTLALIDPLRAKLHEAYKIAGEKVKSSTTPLEVGIKHIKAQILSYDAALERIRQQKLREAQEAQEAEAKRLQAEESARITLAEIDDRLEQGDEKGAQLLFETPIEAPRPYLPPVYLPPAAVKEEGQSTSTTWKVDREMVESDATGAAYVASITKMLHAVKNGSFAIEQAAQLLSWDFGKADKLAGAMMGAFTVPGLTAKPVSTLRISRGKKK